MNEPTSSLLPPLALRVGISGASALALDRLQRLRAGIKDVLNLVRDEMQQLAALPAVRAGYLALGQDKPPPQLRLISPLAEGADRLVAEVALELGFELVCAFPFPQADYENDFGSQESKDHFRALLAKASAPPLELDGGRGDDETRSYEAVGRLVVRNCDLLIAIWNGRPGKGPGGTADTVRFATNYGPPVWWIHAEEDQPPVWLADPHELGKSSSETVDARTALRHYLARLVAPPATPATHPHSLFDRLARVLRRQQPDPYLMRTRPAGPKRMIWRTHSWLITTAARGAPAPWTPPHAPENAVARYWFEQYEPADARAGEYAARYRSSYVLIFGLAALSVVCATVGLAVPHGLRLAMTVLEFAALSMIAVLVWANLRRAWHPLSIEYRLLAELCRKQQALAPLGWSLPGPVVRAKLAANPPGDDADEHLAPDRAAWVEWLFGALLRAAALPTGSFSPEMITTTRAAALNDLVREQLRYHRARWTQSRSAGDRFVHLGELLFFAVLAIVLTKLLLKLVPATADADVLLTSLGVLAALLPAFSAGFVGIRHYAELSLLADQSRHMQAEMAAAERRLSRMDKAHPLASQELAAEIFGVASLMLQDIQGWVQLFRAKVVEPG